MSPSSRPSAPFTLPTDEARRRSAGQALLEFALVAPLLLIALVGVIEAGVFVFNMESLNNATREGARYAIVHGASTKAGCPTGPLPADFDTAKLPAGCSEDATGEDVKAAVRRAAIALADLGDLTVPTPVWTPAGSTDLPDGPEDTPDPSGDNGRGEYVTVFADLSYDPVIKRVFNTDLIPSITISAESTLVINY
jgi:Flp pilus assembly protein TadG